MAINDLKKLFFTTKFHLMTHLMTHYYYTLLLTQNEPFISAEIRNYKNILLANYYAV